MLTHPLTPLIELGTSEKKRELLQNTDKKNVAHPPTIAISHKPTPKRSGWYLSKKDKKDQGCINISNSNTIVHGAMSPTFENAGKKFKCMDIVTWSAKVEIRKEGSPCNDSNSSPKKMH